MRRTFLLGATKNKMVLGEFDLYLDNIFTASFDIGELIYVDDIVDCSCTFLQIDTKKGLANFETISCGQHDITEDDFYNELVFTNKEVVLELLDMWKQYHLKTITTEQVNRLNELLNKLEPYNYDTNEENVKEFVLGIVDNEEEANVN